MADKITIISESINQAKLGTATDDLSAQLQAIKDEIIQHQTQITVLQKQQKVLENHLEDIAQLQTIYSRMKMRETQ